METEYLPAAVANLYYCQPLLSELCYLLKLERYVAQWQLPNSVDFAGAFNVSDSAVSTIPSITQAGCVPST